MILLGLYAIFMPYFIFILKVDDKFKRLFESKPFLNFIYLCIQKFQCPKTYKKDASSFCISYTCRQAFSIKTANKARNIPFLRLNL